MYQLVTGGGKTVLFVDIIKKFILKKKRVMLLAHREELINQAWSHLYKNQILAGIIKADVTPNFNALCQVASIQTVIRRKNIPVPDLIIIDEVHHCQDDNSYGKLVMDIFPNALVLGVTATPYRLNGMGFTSIFQDLILGPTLLELTDMGYLTPLKYFVAKRLPIFTNVSKMAGDFNMDEAEIAMGLAPIVDSYTEHCRGMAGIGFACNIKHSRNIVDLYNAAGIPAGHIDGNMDQDTRRKILEDFKSRRILYLSNVGIVTEGFDVPDLEFVQINRPTMSLALWLQMIGRSTRTDFNIIKHATDDNHRAALVASCKKPYAYILDNAGCHLMHGMPWHEFKWDRHFKGFSKKDKAITERIEIITFVAEDESGRVVKTNVPEEVLGLRLVEITREYEAKRIDTNATLQLDAGIDKLKFVRGIEKKGFAIYNNFMAHCKRSNTLVTDEVWDYITLKLCKEVDDRESVVLSKRDNDIKLAEDSYGHNPQALHDARIVITQEAEKKVKLIRQMKLPSGYLNKMRDEYKKLHKEDFDAIAKSTQGVEENTGF